MKTDRLIEHLELYSNAIVAFFVAQSIVFSLAFGTSPSFVHEVIGYKLLAAGLVAHFVIATAVAALTIRYLRERVIELSREHHQVIRTLYRGKALVVGAFTLIPVLLLTSFGFIVQPRADPCATPDQVATPPVTRLASSH